MSPDNQPTQTPEDNKALSRREVLKTLAAAGSAIGAAAFLPAKWAKPVIEAGVLPAHAQGTRMLEIFNLSVGPANNSVSAPDNNIFYANFDFFDQACQVDDAAMINAWASDCGQFINNKALPAIPAFICGSGPPPYCNGTIDFQFPWPCGTITNASTVTVQLGVGGRLSNKATDSAW